MLYTKGPWAIDPTQPTIIREAHISDVEHFQSTGETKKLGDAVAVATADDLITDEEARGNARIVAAAPEMFELLVKLSEEFDLTSGGKGESTVNSEEKNQLLQQAQHIIRKINAE